MDIFPPKVSVTFPSLLSAQAPLYNGKRRFRGKVIGWWVMSLGIQGLLALL